MASALVSAAFSVVGKALAPFTDSLLKDWAASKKLGDNVNALELELLSAKGILERAMGREIDNSALKELLERLQGLAYDADDVLDELDYFRIQDQLDGTSEAANKHPKGFVHNLALNAKAVGKQIICLPACLSSPAALARAKPNHCREANGGKSRLTCFNASTAVGKCFPCSSLPSARGDDNSMDNDEPAPELRLDSSTRRLQDIIDELRPIMSENFSAFIPTLGSAHDDSMDSLPLNPTPSIPERTLLENHVCLTNTLSGRHFCSDRGSIDDEPTPKLVFNRVGASKRMHDIIKQLRHVRENVSALIATLGSNSWSTAPNITESRPTTTSESIQPTLYGRERTMNSIIHDITKGKHFVEHLTVIPILGVGGIGKTTLAQHIYHSEQVQNHFDVKVWKCVSLNFSANNLIQDIENYIPTVKAENSTSTAGELIGQRLKDKRFLLVLDDIWDCSSEDEWEQLLVPFKKSQVHGNIIIVTTRSPEQAQIMIRKIDHPISLHGLEHKEFMELFLAIVFGNDHKSRKDHTCLLEIGHKIARKLKGSPLAAKTVGRLLKTQLDMDHWNRVLESKEWEQKQGKDDIMHALKLSYDYLPLHLKQCFSFCALFPQDYKFQQEELINFWIGLEILHSTRGENKRVEDIGLKCLTELVNHGFFEKEREEKDGSSFLNNKKIISDYYILHDLLHELAQKVSSHECLSIESSQSSQVRSLPIPPSIRHLSINIDHSSFKDRSTFKNCVDDFSTLDGHKFEKLRTLMLFGYNHGSLVKVIFGDLFREAKALRVVLLSNTSYHVEDLLQNFYNLVHLRYLRIQSRDYIHHRFCNKLSRFYHLMVLDAEQFHIIPIDMSNLIKLRHFHVHGVIPEVGKIKSLQELKSFLVKQEGQGFELRQIGPLLELGGSLQIGNLEKIQVVEEADEAKLVLKSRLRELILCWDSRRSNNSDSVLEEHVLERLEPSSNLQKLSILGNRGDTCPSWLGTNLSVKKLESLCLDGVAWKTFPPIGELWLVNASGEEILSRIPNKRFENLRRLELKGLPQLKRWIVHAPCQLFPYLEVVDISCCSNLVELSFSHSACCQQEESGNVFGKLSSLKIESCHKLSSFPILLPWNNEVACSILIKDTGSSCIDSLVSDKYILHPKFNIRIPGKDPEYNLTISGKDTRDSTCWNLLAFHNLTNLKEFNMKRCQPPPLHHLQKLSSLRKLSMSCSSNAFPFDEGDSHVEYKFPVEQLVIDQWSASGKDLSHLLSYFPKLSYLELTAAEKITELGVMEQQQATATPGPSKVFHFPYGPQKCQTPCASASFGSCCKTFASFLVQRYAPLLRIAEKITPGPSSSSANKWSDQPQQQDTTAEERLFALEAAEGLLLLPPQLQELLIHDCPVLSLRCSNPLDDNKEDGLQGLSSLRRLEIRNCPKILSSYSSSSSHSSCFPFPNSMEDLYLSGRVGMETTVVPLSNLSSLASLSISGCGDLRGCGLSLLGQGNRLTKLMVFNTPNFFVDLDPSRVHEQELPPRSSKLRYLCTDDVARFTATPICSLLFSSLTELEICCDEVVERFTEEQEDLLFVTSLELITFGNCNNLQYLPARIHRLPNLKRLVIQVCEAIQMLPKDGLPSSLQQLEIWDCPGIQSLPEDGLPSSLQKLVIWNCPAIRSLPKVDNLPSSLRELNVKGCTSEELKTQCRKLIGIIPIVEV